MSDTGEFPIEVQQEIERNYRFNFTVNLIDGATFWFAMSFFTPTVILPLYASHFTSNPILLGLIPFLGTAGFLIPQLLVANFVQRAPRKKFFPVTLGFFLERLPVFLIAPSAYFLATNRPGLALASFLLLYAWHTFGAGLTITGWQDMIAKIIPVDRRGRFFGITNFIGSGTGILGALAVPFVLDRYPFPLGYVYTFALVAVLIFISWAFLAMAREPVVRNTKPRVSQAAYMRTLPGVLRRDRNFRNYLLAQVTFYLSGMAAGFLVVYATQRWNLLDAQAGSFTIALQVGSAAANLFFGFLADRKGHKLSLELCMVLSVLSTGLALVAPSPVWFFIIFFLRGAVSAALFISGISIVFEFTGADERATYIGLANTFPGLAGAVAPLFGGWLAGQAGYPVLFALSTATGAIAWAFLRFGVKEPRERIETGR